jgi:hypothetical protein
LGLIASSVSLLIARGKAIKVDHHKAAHIIKSISRLSLGQELMMETMKVLAAVIKNLKLRAGRERVSESDVSNNEAVLLLLLSFAQVGGFVYGLNILCLAKAILPITTSRRYSPRPTMTV